MDYSVEYSDKFLEEMLEYYGDTKVPNPLQYPKRFEFLVKSFEHYKRMKGENGTV